MTQEEGNLLMNAFATSVANRVKIDALINRIISKGEMKEFQRELNERLKNRALDFPEPLRSALVKVAEISDKIDDQSE